MPTFYNITSSAVTPSHLDASGWSPSASAVQPGEGHEFSDEESASLGCEWSASDPRAGLNAEQAFKIRRDKASPAPSDVPETPAESPAEPGKEGQQ